MPRDSNGIYSLPVGNPVATLTVISSNWANTTLSDLSTAMTASLSRAGEGSMLAGLKLFDGTIGAPGMTWGTETTAGFYRASAGNFRFAIGGVDVFTLVAGGLSFGLTDGSAANPSLFFSADPNTGIYRATTDMLAITAGGTFGFGVRLNANIQALIPDGSAANPGIAFNSDQDSGLWRVGADDWALVAGGLFQIEITSLGCYILASPGSATAPTYSFRGDSNTGMYNFGADVIGFTINGAATLTLATGGSTFQAPILVQNGLVGTPSYSFASDPDCGLYRIGTNTIGFSAGGVIAGRFDTTQFQFLDGVVGAPGISFVTDPDTGIYRPDANRMFLVGGGSAGLIIGSSYIETPANGSAAAPMIRLNDADTGFYAPGADQVGISTAGVVRWNVGTGAIVHSLPTNIPDGSAGSPSIRFSSDGDTGIIWGGTNTGELVAGGVLSMLWDDSVTGNDTRIHIYCVAAGTFRRVITGAPNSGGAGFRMLTVVN